MWFYAMVIPTDFSLLEHVGHSQVLIRYSVPIACLRHQPNIGVPILLFSDRMNALLGRFKTPYSPLINRPDKLKMVQWTSRQMFLYLEHVQLYTYAMAV